MCLFGCGIGPEEHRSNAGPRREEERRSADASVDTARVRESFSCVTAKTAVFEPVATSSIAEPSLDGSLPPVVTNARDIVAPFGTMITITGTGFGDGNGGELVSFGEGARELRIPAKTCTDPNDSRTCTYHSWSSTRIDVHAPLGAEGKVVVHARGGSAGAGTFTSPWRSRAPLTLEKLRQGQTLASLDTPDATYVVRSTQRADGGYPDDLTIHRFTESGVAVATFDGLGAITVASLARGPKGEIELALLTATSRLHIGNVRADAIDLDDGCVPADAGGPLAFARTNAGRIAWVTIAKGLGFDERYVERALVRLVDEDGSRTWKVNRVVFTTEVLRGEGVELADGSVGFSWGEGAGGLFDAKSTPMVAVLPAGASTIESTQLAPAMDDYIETRTFPTTTGLVTTYCNKDDTGFLADTSSKGVHCRVLSRTGPREWTPFDGHPDRFENLDHDFALVAGRIASVYRVRGKAEYAYAGSLDATPSMVAAFATEVSFVRADEAAPALFIANGRAATVVRPR